jgi:sulfite exporter TauE/SafE
MIDSIVNRAAPFHPTLYRIGGAAALLAAIFFRRNLDAEVMLASQTGLFQSIPLTTPTTAAAWFSLLQESTLFGLTLLNAFDLLNYALVGFIFLALFLALKPASKVFSTSAFILGFAGILTYFATNQSLFMWSLSNQYAAASAAQRPILLAAGQAALATHQQNSYAGLGLYPSFLLVTVCGLIFAILMLRSTIFKKSNGITGLLANAFGLGYYPFLLLAPDWVYIPLSISAVFLLAWYLLIARRLFQLARVH